MAASTDGKKLAFAAMGGLYLYDLENRSLTTLLNMAQNAGTANISISMLAGAAFAQDNSQIMFYGSGSSIPAADGEEDFSIHGSIAVDGSDLKLTKPSGYEMEEMQSSVSRLFSRRPLPRPMERCFGLTGQQAAPTRFPSPPAVRGKDGVYGSEQGNYVATAVLGSSLTVRVYDVASGALVCHRSDRELRPHIFQPHPQDLPFGRSQDRRSRSRRQHQRSGYAGIHIYVWANNMEITFESVSKQYKSKYALKNFTATLSEGVYGLLGENGAGKTTLINTFVGILRGDSGTIRVDGQDVEDAGQSVPVPNRLYAPVSYLLPGFYRQGFSALYVCAERHSHPRSGDRVSELLATVNLTDAQDKKIGALSGGMRQRVGIVQAMLSDPKILILDEPTAGLDPSERIRFRNLISRFAQGRTILLATHIVSEMWSASRGKSCC